MLQACFALLIEFFVSCFAKIIQLAHTGLHPVKASEIQVEQGILSLLGNCLSHRMTCWVLRAYWAAQAWAVTAARCGLSTSNHIQCIYGFFFPSLLYLHSKISLEPLPTETVFQLPCFALSHTEWTSWGEEGTFKVFLKACNAFLQWKAVTWECFVQESSKALWVIAEERPSRYDVFTSGEKKQKPCTMDTFEANYLAHVMWDRADQSLKAWYRYTSAYVSFPSPASLKRSVRCSSLPRADHLTLMNWEQLRANHSEHILLNGALTPHFCFCTPCSLVPWNCAVFIKRYVALNAWRVGSSKQTGALLRGLLLSTWIGFLRSGQCVLPSGVAGD